MQTANYPDLAEHVAEHVRPKTENLRFQWLINTNFPDGASEFYRFLRDWLINHIQDCDKKYGPYLQDKGITAKGGQARKPNDQR